LNPSCRPRSDFCEDDSKGGGAEDTKVEEKGLNQVRSHSLSLAEVITIIIPAVCCSSEETLLGAYIMAKARSGSGGEEDVH
jgi:hypothetical protein